MDQGELVDLLEHPGPLEDKEEQHQEYSLLYNRALLQDEMFCSMSGYAQSISVVDEVSQALIMDA